VDFNLSVSHFHSEVAGFEFLELGFVLDGLLTFFLSLLLDALAIDLSHIYVVDYFEVIGCYQRGRIEVSAHTLQHLDIVKPHLRVFNLVAVALGYLNGIPILVNV
jgi:hypothetical protein